MDVTFQQALHISSERLQTRPRLLRSIPSQKLTSVSLSRQHPQYPITIELGVYRLVCITLHFLCTADPCNNVTCVSIHSSWFLPRSSSYFHNPSTNVYNVRHIDAIIRYQDTHLANSDENIVCRNLFRVVLLLLQIIHQLLTVIFRRQTKINQSTREFYSFHHSQRSRSAFPFRKTCLLPKPNTRQLRRNWKVKYRRFVSSINNVLLFLGALLCIKFVAKESLRHPIVVLTEFSHRPFLYLSHAK